MQVRINDDIIGIIESYPGSVFNSFDIDGTAVESVTFESTGIDDGEWLSLLEVGVKVLVGYYLVRLTTCKRLTNSLPKLSLITLSPRETAGKQVGRIYGWTCQYPSGLISWGYRGE